MTLTEIEKLANVVVDTTREEDASNLASHTLTLCKLVKVQREALGKSCHCTYNVAADSRWNQKLAVAEECAACAALAAGDALGVG